MERKHYYYFSSSVHAIHNLERKMIKVSILEELNDPFELLPYLRDKSKDENKSFKKIRESISIKYGLLCFSTDWNEPLLWGHYGDKHKGMALGFYIENHDVIDVKYQKDRIKMDFTNRDEKEILLKLARIKYENWDYEQETRMIIDLTKCTKIDGHYFYPFENVLKLREIILGCKFDNSIEYVITLANKYGAEIIHGRRAYGNYSIIKDGRKTGKIQEMQQVAKS
jgi:hypothetical protein